MEVLENKMDNHTLLIVTDKSLSGDTAAEFKIKAVDVMNSGEKNIDIDLSKTEYIDSSGIGKLLFLNKKLANGGGKLSIIKINKTLYEFLDSLAITKVINTVVPD